MLKLSLLALFFFVSSANAKAIEISPYTLIEASSQKIITLMKSEKEVTESDIRPILEEVFTDLIDFKGISRAVMGKHYKIATPEQRIRFQAVLKETFISLYSKVLIHFDIDDATVITPPLNIPFKGSVTMKVTAKNGALYTITYTMRETREHTWKVRNVIIDGINLGLTYRNQFGSSVNHYEGDLDKVITGWEEEINMAEARN